mgnify:FL=1
MTPQELKNSILQLAIQGKLVEQRPEEGTGEELYRQIQAEKQKLIREGKIKKEKPLPEIAEDEVPFDIPESWKWVRLNEIASSLLGKTLNKVSDTGELCPYLCSINVYWEGIKLSTVKEAFFTQAEKEKYLLQKGDLLICEGGDAGRCAVWDNDATMYYQNALHRVRFYGDICVAFFRDIFESYKSNGEIKSRCKGETIQHLVQGELYNMVFPLPPLAEQKRIVAKIEELLPLIDRYEKAWGRLEEFNRRFPADMQKSLLQMAIQGKLVEQRPEEGTGEELYRQIQAEKQRLIKEGKIKKEKPLPEIAEDEVPFEIPESWKWVRVGNITTLNPKNEANDETEAAFIPMTLVADGYRNQHSYEIKKWGEIKKGFTHFTNGDIGIAKITPCFQNRKSVIFDSLVHNLGAGTTELSIVRVIADTVNRKYLLWLFKSDYFIRNGIKSFTGTAGQQRIHKEYLAKCVIPLPSLAEQKRIVAKLEELLPLCERLK